jgi:hypothetical protein
VTIANMACSIGLIGGVAPHLEHLALPQTLANG